MIFINIGTFKLNIKEKKKLEKQTKKTIQSIQKKTEKETAKRKQEKRSKRPLGAVGNTNRDQRPAGLRAQIFAAQTDLWSRLVLPTATKGLFYFFSLFSFCSFFFCFLLYT